MRLFGLKTCDSCKKALKELAADGWAVDFVDVRGPDFSEDIQHEILGKFADKALNRASTTWRTLDDRARESDPAELLKAHPALMKRPVIEHEGRWSIGWKADAKAEWLGAA